MTVNAAKTKLSYLRMCLTGAIVALALGNAMDARAEMGNASDATLGKVLKAEKDTVELVCGLGAACRIDGVFHATFFALQVVRAGPLEQNFQANALGFGSIFSLLDQNEDLIDQLCWSGAGPSDDGSSDVRECVEIFVGEGSPLSCPHDVVRVAPNQDACDAAAELFSPQPVPDYVVSIDETNYASGIDVFTCTDRDVVAQCLPSAGVTQDGAVGLAHEGLGGYDAKRLAGTKYF